MKCVYFYKDKQFNSELELDDFILERLPLEPILGDMVFSDNVSTPQLNVAHQLKVINEQSQKLRQQYKEYRKSQKATYTEDGELKYQDPPYIGVNDFLSGVVTADGTPLFPEFRDEEYWKGRFSHWKLGEYTEQELLEFNFQGTPPKINDIKELEKKKQQMQYRWKNQADAGSAVHEVLQICMSQTEGTYNLLRDDLLDIINKNISKKYEKYLNEQIINETITYAKKLYEDLKLEYGNEIMIFPEFCLSADTNIIHDGTPTTLLGFVDLLIVDKTGKIHILDYKTSIKDYSDFGSAKRLSYTYQMATYHRILEKQGLNMYGGELLVSPIQLKGFRKENNKYLFDGIIANSSYENITPNNNEKLWDNIDDFMPAPFKLNITTEQATQTVSEMMSKWFPDYTNNNKLVRDQVIDILKKYKALEPNEKGQYRWRKETGGFIISNSKEDFINQVVKYEQSLPAKRIRLTADVKKSLKQAIEKGIENANFMTPVISASEGETEWLQNMLSPYCDGVWEVVDNELLESFGVILLQTKDGHYPQQVDFVRVSNNYLTYNKRERKGKISNIKGTGLTGRFESDLAQQSKSNSLMLSAANGNVELIETMLLINQMNGLEGKVIGKINVVNPRFGNGISATNEELLYCWNSLNTKESVKNNKFESGAIKLASKYEQARQKFNHIMTQGAKIDWKDGYQNFRQLKSCVSVLDENINASVDEQIAALNNVLRILLTATTRNGQTPLDKIYTTQKDLNSKEIALYRSILEAIANLKGINFRQQLSDHDKWAESFRILTKGHSGTYIDNPGNLSSDTLNLVTKLVTEAYQNTRDTLQNEKAYINKLINKLKQEKNFNLIKERTYGNAVDLYSNLYRISADGDFLFKHINDVEGAEKELLKYSLCKINKNRFPNHTDEQLKTMEENGDLSYYRVPLARGNQDSVASTRGLLSVFKSKLHYLLPQNAIKLAREKAEGLFNSEEDIKHQQQSQLLFSMTNLFDKGEVPGKRINKIEEIGIENFEHDLEKLLYKHIFAYEVKENIDQIFPLIKASMMHLAAQGSNQNVKFESDMKYLENYIRSKILHQSIIDPKFQQFAQAAGMIKQAASLLTLAVAPVQALYQPLQGLWTDIRLMIQKPDGKESFTFSNFSTALKTVYSDLSHFTNEHTPCSALNELYALNDMDMNLYAERISQGQKGIWNLTHFFFKFASRPDYYNRLTIFVAQMLGDGSYKAHKLVNGRLEYNWEEDARFEVFAKGKISDPKYNEQRSLYYTVARQFVKEGAKDKDGNLFILDMNNPKPLPRAYTNLQVESMKSLSDDIYGYYSDEKKSLILSTTVGSLWLQFKTYWSGKKNQYFQAGGVRLRGSWEHYEENGQKYYYQVDEKGNILYNKPPTTTSTIAPVIQWKGQWQEGIFITLADMIKTMYNTGSIKEGWNSKMGEDLDPDLKRAYQSNLRQFVYDLCMFIFGGCIMGSLLGDWLDDLKDKHKKNKDFVTGLQIAAANVAVLSVRNSFLDFNTLDSTLSPLGQWTPFAFDWSTRMIKNLVEVGTGDEDIWDGIIKCSGGLKQIKPVLDSIKPDMFRTKREGGTFGED